MLNASLVETSTGIVAPARPGQVDALFSTLTLAFAADPAARWMFPDPQQYLRWFPEFARAFAGAAIADGTAWVCEDLAGAALWLRPDADFDDKAFAAVIADGVADREKAHAFAVFDEMARWHPAEPHWYLPLIGVEPARQGHGSGGALLQPVLAQCDETRQLAYLEATSPKNRTLYERHGFRAVGEIRVGGCPPITPMLRKPRPRGPAFRYAPG